MHIEDEMPPFNLVDELAMLLSAVAKAAATTGLTDVCEVIAKDKYAQAHFACFSAHLHEMTGLDAALIEYAPKVGEAKTKVIMNDEQNKAGWAVWERIG